MKKSANLEYEYFHADSREVGKYIQRLQVGTNPGSWDVPGQSFAAVAEQHLRPVLPRSAVCRLKGRHAVVEKGHKATFQIVFC